MTLDEQVGAHLERKARAAEAEAERRRAEAEAREAAEAEEDSSVIEDTIGGLLAGLKPKTEEEILEHAWRTEICPKLDAYSVPKRFWYRLKEWNCVPQQRVFTALRKLCGTGGGAGSIIALIGERGAGKTTLAAQLIQSIVWEDWRRLYEQQEPGFLWRTAVYRKMSDLIARFKPLYADFGSIDSEVLVEYRKRFCRYPLVIIDELHDCEDQRLKERVLTDLIDRRYANMVDTVLISNQSDAEFRASAGDSVVSRISEGGMIIPCEWGSWRSAERKPLVLAAGK